MAAISTSSDLRLVRWFCGLVWMVLVVTCRVRRVLQWSCWICRRLYLSWVVVRSCWSSLSSRGQGPIVVRKRVRARACILVVKRESERARTHSRQEEGQREGDGEGSSSSSLRGRAQVHIVVLVIERVVVRVCGHSCVIVCEMARVGCHHH